MPNILNNLSAMVKLDKSNLRGSIDELYLQVKQAWFDVGKIKLNKKYKKIKNIVVAGMGGSALGAHIIRSIYKDRLKIPLTIVNGYTLPKFVNKETLIILSSYSGDTEEVISCAKDAVDRKTKILGIASNGKLQQFCQKNKIPCYVINPKHNPSGQPRMGVGYSIIGQLGLLAKCGMIKISQTEIDSVVNYLKKLNKKFKPSAKNNTAKKLAINLYNKIPILAASEFLQGNIHALANQINENAKTIAVYFFIPELNHYLIEGLIRPKCNPKTIHFLFFSSKLYHTRNRQRYKITQQIVKKNRISFSEYKLRAKNKLEQSFEILILGSYISFYLAMLNNIDPSRIPWINYLKKYLASGI